MNAIERGTFNYAEMFPDSKYVKATSRKAVKQPTIAELITDYIDTARKTKSLSPSTIVSYLRWANHRLIPQWGNQPAADITPLQLTQWIADLSTELTPKSVRNCVGLLSAVLNRAAGYGIIKTNPLAPIKLRNFLPKRSRSDDDDIDPFNDAEIDAILSACETVQDRALFQFAFSTGLRTGELIAIKWTAIDKLRNQIMVTDNIVWGEVGTVEKSTKTDKGRVIPILPGAAEAIAAMRPISEIMGSFIFLHPNHRGRWSDDQQIRTRWKTILRRAGVRYRNPYQTRHTFASRLLMAGEQELLVAKLLGHASVEMVRRHYGKYIKQPDGMVLRGDYSGFGANLGQSEPSITQQNPTKKIA